jgi:hypothetical protein
MVACLIFIILYNPPCCWKIKSQRLSLSETTRRVGSSANFKFTPRGVEQNVYGTRESYLLPSAYLFS